MNPSDASGAALRWDGARLAILDQTLLPHREQWLTLNGAADTADAIRAPRRPRRAADRRSPRLWPGDGGGARRPTTGARVQTLRAARPTAVNLALGGRPGLGGRRRPGGAEAARAEAERIEAEEDAASAAIAAHGADLLAARGGSSPTATPARSRPAARARRSA